MDDIIINDSRPITDFKYSTFSNFKLNEVKKQLINNLKDSKIEQSLYWSAEIICAGHFLILWDIIILFYSKNIHLGNPKLIVYIEIRFNQFRNIINNGYRDNEIKLRNNPKIRKLFAEIICILCLSKKFHSFEEIKLNINIFNMTNITEKLQAPTIDFITPFFKENDPKNIFIPLNEFTYNISIKNSIDTCYWLEYILHYELFLKKKKEKCICEKRTFIQIETKFQNDIIWIIWEIIIHYAEKKNIVISKIINSAFQLFSLKYNYNHKQKRKFIIYYVITLITSDIIIGDEEIVKDKDKLLFIVSKINNIYNQIKSNEIEPKTEYSYKDIKDKNMEKTILRIEQMKHIEHDFIPRTKDFMK